MAQLAYNPGGTPLYSDKPGAVYQPNVSMADYAGGASGGTGVLTDSPTTAAYQSQASQMGGSMNTAGDAVGQAAMIPGPQQPFVAGASLGLKTAGSVADIYGKYVEREEAKQRYETQLKLAQQVEKERKEALATEKARQSRQEGYFASDFSQGLEDRLAGSYGGYRTPGGA